MSASNKPQYSNFGLPTKLIEEVELAAHRAWPATKESSRTSLITLALQHFVEHCSKDGIEDIPYPNRSKLKIND